MKTAKPVFSVLVCCAMVLLCACSPNAQNPLSGQSTAYTAASQPAPEDEEATASQADASSQTDRSSLSSTALGQLSNQKVTWGPGKTSDGVRPPDPLKLQEQYGQYNASFIAPDTKKIYLTFDEGYEAGYTPQILNTLREKQVSAVFFVTYPYAQQNPELIRRMIEEGHIVGNHTKRHPSMPDVDLQRAEEEIMFLHDYIKSEFQYDMFLFRPPEGAFSERTLALAQQLGYQTVFWSFAYADWDTRKQPDEATALQRITSSAHNGAIYLLHATSITNANILGEAIDQLRADGYELAKYDLYAH